MLQARWNEIETLFNTAVGLTVGERAAFLKEFCGDDPELCDEVVELLTEADESSEFLERSILKTGLRVIGGNGASSSTVGSGREAA